MKMSITVEHDKYKITHVMEDDCDLFLRDYLEFVKAALHSAGFSYIVDLAADTTTDVVTATETLEYWQKQFKDAIKKKDGGA